MSHILRAREIGRFQLPHPHAAIRVRVVNKKPRRLQVDPDPKNPLCIVFDGALSPLPSTVEVVAPDGVTVIDSEGRFYITNESFDPYHLLLDYMS